MTRWPSELSHLKIVSDPDKDPFADRRSHSGARGTDEDLQNIRFVLTAEDGTDRYFNAWIHTVVLGQKSLGRSVLIQDITDNVILMKKLEEAAFTDGLTGLFNRKHFMELASMKIDHCDQQQIPCSLLMFDLDFFKKVNDTYGHLAGDEVLRCTAQQVQRAVRSADILGRYGGEEFVVFMDGADATVALKLAERIRAIVEKMDCVFEGTEIRITCSVGVMTSAGSLTLEQLVEKADEALYEAKQTGRNKVCISAL
jgi:diguanylate cyclase (GGDEF)-like protein